MFAFPLQRLLQEGTPPLLLQRFRCTGLIFKRCNYTSVAIKGLNK